MPILTELSSLIVPYAGMILIIAVGILAARQRVLTEERITFLSEIVIVLILPIFTFWNAATGSVMSVLNQAPWMIGLGLFGGLAGYVIASALARLAHWDWARRSVLQVSGVSGNTGFLGIPICTAIYGSQGAILALLYDFGATIYLLTIGMGAYQQNSTRPRGRAWLVTAIRQFCNPIFISLLLGLGVALAKWDLPYVLKLPLESLSNTTIPLMMLILGGIIYNSAVKYRVDKHGVFLLGFLKLLILPGLTWLAVLFLPLSGVSSSVAIVEAAMPSAVMAVALAARFGADENLAASGTMVTTLLSILTIPLFAASAH